MTAQVPALPHGRACSTACALAALALVLGSAAAHAAAPLAPAGMGLITPPPCDDGLPEALRASLPLRATPAAGPARGYSATGPDYAHYIWPLERSLQDGVMAVNYVDLDPTPGIADYEGGTITYDGHTGHDYALYDFRSMDRGCEIRAAASGTVAYLDDSSPYDRNCDFNWPDFGNWVWIAYGDGTYHEYLHMRSNSMTVQLGDNVQAGEMLGLVGSSGHATIPHLHFESGDYDGAGGAYEWRDPSHGPLNPLPSLWNVQYGYAGANPFWVADLGVFTEAQVSGSVFNTTYCDVVQPLVQPLVYGANEAHLCMWFLFQTPANDSVTITVRKADGTVYGSFPYASSTAQSVGWIWAYYFLSPYVGAADYGTWHLEVARAGATIASKPFTIGAATQYAPRFWPRGGRSFLIDGSVQSDTLRRFPLGPAVTYSLVNSPSYVSLVQDSIVRVGPVSTQASRSAYFKVLMTDGVHADTAYYHTVDFSKPLDPLTEAPARSPGSLALAVSPQPAPGEVTLTCALPRPGACTLELLDPSGRRVRTFVRGPRAAGTFSVRWDGRDARGGPAPAGIYFARLVTDGGALTRRIVRLR